jgi:hypothetical protein
LIFREKIEKIRWKFVAMICRVPIEVRQAINGNIHSRSSSSSGAAESQSGDMANARTSLDVNAIAKYKQDGDDRKI